MTFQEWSMTISGGLAIAGVYQRMAKLQPTKFELDKAVRGAYERYKEKYGDN